jgi:hypothetical protein
MSQVHNEDDKLIVLDLVQDPIFAHPQAIGIPARKLLYSPWPGIERKSTNRVRNSPPVSLLNARQPPSEPGAR